MGGLSWARVGIARRGGVWKAFVLVANPEQSARRLGQRAQRLPWLARSPNPRENASGWGSHYSGQLETWRRRLVRVGRIIKRV